MIHPGALDSIPSFKIHDALHLWDQGHVEQERNPVLQYACRIFDDIRNNPQHGTKDHAHALAHLETVMVSSELSAFTRACGNQITQAATIMVKDYAPGLQYRVKNKDHLKNGITFSVR